MSLDLSPEIEFAVRERAAAEGVSVNDLLARTFVLENTFTSAVANPKEHVRALLAHWRARDNTPTLPYYTAIDGETPTQRLFRKWEEEDANMNEDEQEQEAKFWEEFQLSINTERAKTNMRTLF